MSINMKQLVTPQEVKMTMMMTTTTTTTNLIGSKDDNDDNNNKTKLRKNVD